MNTTQHSARVLRTLMVVQICTGLANGATFGVGALIAAKLGGTQAGGLASTMITLGSALTAVPLARLVASKGRRVAMTTGIATGMFGALLAAIAANTGSFALVIAAFFLLGTTGAINLQSRFAAAETADESSRGRNISLVVWCTTVGAVAGPNLLPLGASVGGTFGIDPYAAVFLIGALALLAALPLVHFGLAGTPAARPQSVAQEQHGAAGPQAVPKGAYLVIAMMAGAHFTMVALMSMTPVHMQAHGAAISLIGITISLHILGMFGFSPVFGMSVDKLGHTVTLTLGFVLLAASILLLIFVGQSHEWVVAALILLGLGWSAALVSTSAMLQEKVPPHVRPRFQGRNDMLMNIAGALGGLIAGPIVSVYGMPAMAMVCGGVLLVLTLIGVRGFTAGTKHQRTKTPSRTQ